MKIMKLHPEQIRIPGERFRNVDKKEAAELADSIRRLGQINPVTVEFDTEPDGDFVLIAGEHRLYAISEILKRDEIFAVLKEDVDPLLRREIELEENVRRKDMTAAEKVAAIAEIHRLRLEKDPNWTQTQTAALVKSKRQADVSTAVNLAGMVKLFPELASAKSVAQLESWAKAKAKTTIRTHDVRDQVAQDATAAAVAERIWHGDSVELIKQVPDGVFNAIITDPPFGVDYDNRTSGTIGSLTNYEDSEDSYHRILSMAPDLYRVLKPDGFLVWFFGMSWYDECKRAFRDAGFIVDELPIVWNRSRGKTYTQRPDRYFGRGYDVALHCIKGDPQIVRRGESNVLTIDPIPSSEKQTLVERPIELYEELITRLTVKGETVADFFVGGGGCPAAAARSGRNYFGIELDADRRAYAINKILANTPDGGK